MVAPTLEDEDALDVVRALVDVLRSASVPAPDAASSGCALQLARELALLLPDLAPGLLFTGVPTEKGSKAISHAVPACLLWRHGQLLARVASQQASMPIPDNHMWCQSVLPAEWLMPCTCSGAVPEAAGVARRREDSAGGPLSA